MLALLLMIGTSVALDANPPTSPLSINRRWEVLNRPRNDNQRRRQLLRAAELLKEEVSIKLAGIVVDSELLEELGKTSRREPLLRAVRERFRRPVDLDDFLLFLDDVLVASRKKERREFWVSGGRARSAGIFLHPDDVYRRRPRRYGEKRSELAVDKPARPSQVDPAQDGDVLGPEWTARFVNPSDREGLEAALAEVSPEFLVRVRDLLDQLEKQGAEVYLTSTVRKQERGYLMWGAFYLSRSEDDTELDERLDELEELNIAWNLNVPIQWRHPKGLSATREAARTMSDAYDVVYATRRGAEKSDHYDGSAVDFVAFGLPRQLTVRAPDGGTKTFNLSHSSQSRDISLTPRLVKWIEEHFVFRKLKSDYPHWDDAKDED